MRGSRSTRRSVASATGAEWQPNTGPGPAGGMARGFMELKGTGMLRSQWGTRARVFNKNPAGRIHLQWPGAFTEVQVARLLFALDGQGQSGLVKQHMPSVGGSELESEDSTSYTTPHNGTSHATLNKSAAVPRRGDLSQVLPTAAWTKPSKGSSLLVVGIHRGPKPNLKLLDLTLTTRSHCSVSILKREFLPGLPVGSTASRDHLETSSSIRSSGAASAST